MYTHNSIAGQIRANNGVVSGASQVASLLPGGTVSSSLQYPGWITSSTQVVWASVNYNTGIVSSSTQVQPLLPGGTVSSSAQYPGWVTASSQIDYNSITNKLSGVVSSSTQVVSLVASQNITPVSVTATYITASSLTANQAVFTNGDDGLVSNAITGTGNVVMSVSPTLTGTLTAANITATGATLLSGSQFSGIVSGSFTVTGSFNLSGSSVRGIPEHMILALSDESSSVLTAGTSKVVFRAPYAMYLYQIPRASVSQSSSSGLVTVDINENGTSILGANKLSIDAGEKTSTTAATPTTLADTSIADDAEITLDIDSAGTGARGLKVILYYQRV